MELIFILSVVPLKILLANFLQVVEIVGAVRIDALMKEEVFPFFLSHKSFSAVRTAQDKLFEEAVFPGEKWILHTL